MKKLDLIILADRHCSTSKTYVYYLAKRGFLIRKILLIDFGPVPPFYKWLVKYLPVTWMEKISKFFFKKAPFFSTSFKNICHFFQGFVVNPINYFKDFNYQHYAQEIGYACCVDINDELFQKFLANQKIQTFLYTNGGIASEHLLKYKGRRIFHVHPGIVPHIKGSDGLLWSFLMRRKVGASCFYMNSGIDTGDIIDTKEWDLPKFENYTGDKLSQDMVYRALLYSFDPHLRAELFADVMEKHHLHLKDIITRQQSYTEGRTYYVMHPHVVKYTFEKMGLSSMIHPF